MVRTVVWNGARSIGQLPGDKQTPLAADPHTGKALVKARNRATDALSKRHGLYIAQLGFAVVSQHRLAVLVPQRRPGMVGGGIELDSIGGPPARVEDRV